MIQEAYIQGLHTRAVDDLVKALSVSGISKSQVSRLAEVAPLTRPGASDRRCASAGCRDVPGRTIRAGAGECGLCLGPAHLSGDRCELGGCAGVSGRVRKRGEATAS